MELTKPAGGAQASPSGPQPRLLADLGAALAQAEAGQGGALWRLAEPGRQLDANLVRVAPGANVAPHVGDLDVLLLVVAGNGTLHTEHGSVALTPQALMWMPRESRRAISAGPEGLAYLTVHRVRPGMTIKLPTDPEQLRRLEEREEEAEGGDAACWLSRVCPVCGALAAGRQRTLDTCPACGAAWPDGAPDSSPTPMA